MWKTLAAAEGSRTRVGTDAAARAAHRKGLGAALQDGALGFVGSQKPTGSARGRPGPGRTAAAAENLPGREQPAGPGPGLATGEMPPCRREFASFSFIPSVGNCKRPPLTENATVWLQVLLSTA